MFKQFFRAGYLLALISLCTLTVTHRIHAEDAKANAGDHAESSERLVTIMRQLFTVVHNEEKVTAGDMNKDKLADMVESVEELLFFAEVMSNKVPVSELEETEAVIFSALADRLYDEALNVQQLVTTYEMENAAQHQLLNEAYHRLNRTCNACHQTFRDQFYPQG